MSGQVEDLVKIAVRSDDGEIETMWALDEGHGRYRLRNLPYLANGLAIDDIVTARREEGRLAFEKVVERSGHSTYRLALRNPMWPDEFEKAWAPIRASGCGFERFSHGMIGVDVPPDADIEAAYKLFMDGMNAGLWWFDEVQFSRSPSRGIAEKR